MVKYDISFFNFDELYILSMPYEILLIIVNYHKLFNEKWLKETLNYHIECSKKLKPSYVDKFLKTIHLFRPTKKSYKTFHPILSFLKLPRCDICNLIFVGKYIYVWNEQNEFHRPWGKRNKKSGKIKRCGIKSKICYECSVRYCCKCESSISNKNKNNSNIKKFKCGDNILKIPPKGYNKCLNCTHIND